MEIDQTPYALMGGRDSVRALAERFYDEMEAHQPALARLHEMDEQGRVSPGTRERFGLFLIGWLGGPQEYVALHGHPRLRMRHVRVPVDASMRDAWLDCMRRALDAQTVTGPLRNFLDRRFLEVAEMLRNTGE